jgi:2-methylisocitrate lyase-like PEP mutase family enzyme
MTAGGELRRLLVRGSLVDAPGAHDVLTAMLIEATGYEVVYIGGSSVCATIYGTSDVGLVTIPELIEHAARVVDAVGLPVVCDLDDCGGNPLAVYRNVERADRAGIAAFHLEDTDASQGKHLAPVPTTSSTGPSLHPGPLRTIADAVNCIKAATDARGSSEMLVIARTDAPLDRELPEVIERCHAYAEAGADMIFPTYLPAAHVQAVAAAVDVPVMTNGIAPEDVEAAAADGLQLLIHPSMCYAAAVTAVHRRLLEHRGQSAPAMTQSQANQLGARTTGKDEWVRRAQRYGMST